MVTCVIAPALKSQIPPAAMKTTTDRDINVNTLNTVAEKKHLTVYNIESQ